LVEGFSDRIVKFVPGEGCKLMEARLPSPRLGTAAVWDGQQAVLLGGTTSVESGPSGANPIDFTDEVLIFDPIEDRTYAFWAWLPTARDTRSAILVQERIYVLGGTDADGPILVAIVAWSFRTWREPPMLSGGPFQG
jgi:hypothetical protein